MRDFEKGPVEIYEIRTEARDEGVEAFRVFGCRLLEKVAFRLAGRGAKLVRIS